MRPLNAIIIVINLLLTAVFVGYVWPIFREFRSFSRLEQRAQSSITARELQAWATDLLEQYPPGETHVTALDTNFPKQLRGLCGYPPSIIVYESRTNNAGTVDPGWVCLAWGSPLSGYCGFEIGPTNFPGHRSGHAWSEGVYFWKD